MSEAKVSWFFYIGRLVLVKQVTFDNVLMKKVLLIALRIALCKTGKGSFMIPLNLWLNG